MSLFRLMKCFFIITKINCPKDIKNQNEYRDERQLR